MKPTTDSLLLRSVLYVPGSNLKTLTKAPTLGADALLLDLEDSVAPEAKASARLNVLATLQQTANQDQFLRIVRLNSTQTQLWQEDLETILPGRPDALAIPKTDATDDLTGPDERLGQLGSSCPLWAMIESPLGVVNSFAIAKHPRVACLVMGTSDLTRAMNVPSHPNRLGLRFALQQTILAARAAGVQVLDGVFLNLSDSEGFLAECQDGLQLGFDGKTVIHPRQIEPANRLFLPTDEEVKQAWKILNAWQTARNQGEEICVLDGRLVERLHANQATQRIAKWEQAKKRI